MNVLSPQMLFFKCGSPIMITIRNTRASTQHHYLIVIILSNPSYPHSPPTHNSNSMTPPRLTRAGVAANSNRAAKSVGAAAANIAPKPKQSKKTAAAVTKRNKKKQPDATASIITDADNSITINNADTIAINNDLVGKNDDGNNNNGDVNASGDVNANTSSPPFASANNSPPPTRTGMFHKLTMSLGSIIGVGSPSSTEIGASNELSAHDGLNAITAKTMGLREEDIVDTSTNIINVIDHHVGGKTSGLTEADYEEKHNESSNAGDLSMADDDNSKDGDFVPEDLYGMIFAISSTTTLASVTRMMIIGQLLMRSILQRFRWRI